MHNTCSTQLSVIQVYTLCFSKRNSTQHSATLSFPSTTLSYKPRSLRATQTCPTRQHTISSHITAANNAALLCTTQPGSVQLFFEDAIRAAPRFTGLCFPTEHWGLLGYTKASSMEMYAATYLLDSFEQNSFPEEACGVKHRLGYSNWRSDDALWIPKAHDTFARGCLLDGCCYSANGLSRHALSLQSSTC